MSFERVDTQQALSILGREYKAFPARVRTIVANLVMSVGEDTIQVIDPSITSRNVNLPTETSSEGKLHIIFNLGTSTGTLVLQSSAGAALSPAKTIAVGGGAICWCDGVAWRALLLT